MPENFMSYIGREKCGCITMVVSDRPENKKDVAKFVRV
jgi:hypothetical protein